MKQITTQIIISIIATILACLMAARVENLKQENSVLKNNQNALLSERESIIAESQIYKVSDSLNAAKVTELRLSLSEYKKYRSQDLKLIEQLKVNKSDLQKVISSQSETIYGLSARLKDSIIITEKPDTLKCFDYKSKWTDASGCLRDDSIELYISNRESLKIAETVKYKRFLGFLWKTNKVKSRQIDIVSENPSTKILNIEYINIEQ